MKKILSILLFSLITSQVFGANLILINETNANYGWKAKIASPDGIYITNYRYIPENGDSANFNNLPNDYTIKIISKAQIGKQTGRSSSYVTLSKNINSDENITVYIRECTKSDHSNCTHPKVSNDKDDASMGQGGVCYYVTETELVPNLRM